MRFQEKQFVFAREYRGYSQTELAAAITGLSQSNLSKFEKGLGSLSNEIIQEIIRFLNFPEDFFYKDIRHKPLNAHYRKKATITKKVKVEIEQSNRIIGYIVDQMTEAIEWPEFKLQPMDLEEGYSPESIASFTRKHLRLSDDEPVRDICGLLERYGILVIEVENSEKFDGVSFPTDNGVPLIIINKNFPNDRKRFTIAHELGHLLMHVLGNFPIPDFRDEKVIEQEANRFASEFLMPSVAIKGSLKNLRMSALGELKRYWLTSMASIIKRAYDLSCVDMEKYRYLNMELSRSGKKRNEDIEVYIDRPSLFFTAYKMHKDDLGYSDEELRDAFGLPSDIIKRFCHARQHSGKLRIVI